MTTEATNRKSVHEKYRELREAFEAIYDGEAGCPVCTGGARRGDGGRSYESAPHEDWCPIGAAVELVEAHGPIPDAEVAEETRARYVEPARPLVLVNVIDGTARAEAFDLGEPSVVVLDWDAIKNGDLTPDDWTGLTDAEWDALEQHASGCVADLSERGFKRPA